mgnify:CR=1 FL=1
MGFGLRKSYLFSAAGLIVVALGITALVFSAGFPQTTHPTVPASVGKPIRLSTMQTVGWVT